MEVNKISKSIFREYDIRGRETDDELNPQAMELIGRAYGTYLAREGVGTVVCGRDNRATSEEFQKAAIKGLMSAGRKIINLGVVTTPMAYWAQHYFKTEGALMVTASHNPKGWNGVKVADGYSSTFHGEKLQKLYKHIITGDLDDMAGGEIEEKNIKEPYIKDLVSRTKVAKKFKILVNTGNGTAGIVLPDLFRAAGHEVIERFTEPDPDYPNYTPNPAEMDMLEDTAQQTQEHKADLGTAFDGDGDRLGLVDEKGNIIWPDRYMIFLARYVLENKPGAKILFDVKSSQALEEDIKKHGGVPLMVPTGHSKIKQLMQQEKAELGGELSGHIFFKFNYYGFDDAAFTALVLLQYFAERDAEISQQIEDAPYYIATPGYNAETPDDKKHRIVLELVEEFKKDGYEVIDMDGARVNFKDGWGLVRASNTSPNLTLRFEAKTQERLEEIQDVFRKKLSQYKFVSQEWIPG